MNQAEIKFNSQDCILRPVLKACINSFSLPGQVFYISNNPKRWSSDMITKCKPFFINLAPDGFYPVEPENLFKEILDFIICVRIKAVVMVSNEALVENGQVFEIAVELKPICLPLRKINEVKVEMMMENLVRRESIGLEYLVGSSWVISSISSDFFNLCNYLTTNDLYMICSCEFDLDNLCESCLPIFYAIIPAEEYKNHALIKRIPSKEYLRNINLPPIAIFNEDTKLTDFIERNFEIIDFHPKLYNSGLHQKLFCSIENKDKRHDEEILNGSENSLFGFMRNSLKKKRGRKTKCL